MKNEESAQSATATAIPTVTPTTAKYTPTPTLEFKIAVGRALKKYADDHNMTPVELHARGLILDVRHLGQRTIFNLLKTELLYDAALRTNRLKSLEGKLPATSAYIRVAQVIGLDAGREWRVVRSTTRPTDPPRWSPPPSDHSTTISPTLDPSATYHRVKKGNRAELQRILTAAPVRHDTLSEEEARELVAAMLNRWRVDNQLTLVAAAGALWPETPAPRLAIQDKVAKYFKREAALMRLTPTEMDEKIGVSGSYSEWQRGESLPTPTLWEKLKKVGGGMYYMIPDAQYHQWRRKMPKRERSAVMKLQLIGKNKSGARMSVATVVAVGARIGVELEAVYVVRGWL